MTNHETQYRVLEHHTFLQAKYGSENVFATMLYGSQNYGLDTPESDVDTKALILPTFHKFVTEKKWLSVEHEVGDGLTNVKDVRAMFENFLKSNINFLEVLFTDFKCVNCRYDVYWKELYNQRNMVANADPRKLMHAAAGMAAQKFHALEKPFESKAAVLAKYGYDPKQLHHLARLDMFMGTYLSNTDFGACLHPNTHSTQYLTNFKTNPIPLEDARVLAKRLIESVDSMVKTADNTFENNPQTAEHAKEFLEGLAVDLLREHLQYELEAKE